MEENSMAEMASQRWLRLMPAIFITYSFAYVDRANYGFGSAAGMAADLHIDDSMNALLGALFFLGYFLFQVPGAIYAERRSAKRLVFWSMIGWGVLASATGLLHDIRLLAIDRFLLGIVESAVMPAMLILLSHWFTRQERSRANTILILGNPVTVLWMSVVSGYLVQAVGWRGMFIAEGLPPILWAFIWWRLVEDEPHQAAWLGAGARDIEARLVAEQQGMAPVRNYAAAFRTPSVLLLTAQYMFWSIGIYGFILWLPSILKTGSSLGIVAIGWLSSLPYLAAALMMVATSFISDRSLVRRGVV
jgi:sugar phosphate permease